MFILFALSFAIIHLLTTILVEHSCIDSKSNPLLTTLMKSLSTSFLWSSLASTLRSCLGTQESTSLIPFHDYVLSFYESKNRWLHKIPTSKIPWHCYAYDAIIHYLASMFFFFIINRSAFVTLWYFFKFIFILTNT